jgi:hypothetical protein
LSVPGIAQHQSTFTTIDAPLAGGSYGYGTEVIAVNSFGVAAGYYVGYDNIVHGYARTPDGTFIKIDGPECRAGQTSQCVPSSLPDADDPYTPPVTWINLNAPGTYAAAVDLMGGVTGYYVDANGVAYGFLRRGSGPTWIRDEPWGEFTSIVVPDAGTQAGQGTFPINMNWEGTIAGYYVDANNGYHGFVRAHNGAITKFDVPDGIANTWVGWAQCISATGAVAGTYFDSAGQSYGFVRHPSGKSFTTFEYMDPDQNQDLTAWSGQGTNIWGINTAGTTVGAFIDANNIYHGLVRTADGQITVFDAPRAAAGAHTVSEAINDEGAVVGFYNDANGVHHGFLRSADSRFTYFDDPNAGGEFHQGTVPMFNIGDTVAGFYEDGDYVWHGFMRK